MLCTLVEYYLHFGWKYCPYLQVQRESYASKIQAGLAFSAYLWPRRWRQYVPPKICVDKAVLFLFFTVRISNLTRHHQMPRLLFY